MTMCDMLRRVAMFAVICIGAGCSEEPRTLAASSVPVPDQSLVQIHVGSGHDFEIKTFDSGHVMLIETIALDRLADIDPASFAFDPSRVTFSRLYRELIDQAEVAVAPLPDAIATLQTLDDQFAALRAATPAASDAATPDAQDPRYNDYNINAEFADDFRTLANRVCRASAPAMNVCEAGRQGWDQLSTFERALVAGMYNESNAASDAADMWLISDPCATHADANSCDEPPRLLQRISVPPRSVVLTSTWYAASEAGAYKLEVSGDHWGWAARTE